MENREVNLLNLIGVLRKKFLRFFLPRHNIPTFPEADFHRESINNFFLVFEKKNEASRFSTHYKHHINPVKVTAKRSPFFSLKKSIDHEYIFLILL
jgi:hypothetical protein